MSCRVTDHDPASRARVDNAVCEHCAARGVLAIRELHSAWLGLTASVGRGFGNSGGDEPVTRAVAGSKPLIKAHVWDLAVDIERKITEWESYLQGQRLMADPGAPQVIEDALALRDRAFRMLRWDDLIHHLSLPCPECDVKELYRPNGEEWQTCRACGLFLSARDYKIAVDLAVARYGLRR